MAVQRLANASPHHILAPPSEDVSERCEDGEILIQQMRHTPASSFDF